ncbi:bifunctional proline dehydrogenase/L-glutamate gamma-semialdehyde dehydrogenase PutA [Psychromarinibacter halotolerans]|uniref:Bifunctional protein PutA n=1 Tax=Psychromarinibacter halotolerans TaxID=1775175 RepID=A0ABV7GSZ4_9RHOB|nr:bifunctional proline dehydrogenase/L-glutamate gamma-semialdehyde dehydrogenase PutA [Psychromarinibacter halotolerans]MDF0598722.1 bifunctional proline dehydrogenase/L-glutamate gamma-semialdehyde dehydrogenase PutA [Psychromarinibacter halotolerans]
MTLDTAQNTPKTDTIRARIADATYADETATLAELAALADLSAEDRARISTRAAGLVRDIRSSARPGLMEVFLAEYGLSTDEGIALMCLAEALLRVPDAETIDALIEDKIAPSDWGRHLGHSSSSLVNASTWALMLTGRVLDDQKPGVTRALRGAVKRLGEPVIRTAVGRAMREMGRQFVLGETINSAMSRAAGMEAKGYTYSYDMLGEAARTGADAERYFHAYAQAIGSIGKAATDDKSVNNPGISVKLSALHPRYEEAQRDRVMTELVPRLQALAKQAAAAGMGLNIDAEEADRLDLSLDVIEAALADEALHGWDGFGLVVQAYGPRARHVIDWFYALAERLDRRFTLRLVKGAYWDTEIKHAQVIGAPGFTVFSRKPATDVSYIACARKLLGLRDRIYPQFATHNAHTTAAVLEMADSRDGWEFQRLHGMGERLHDILMKEPGARCRIYAPVGAHRDLLAYLVRRLLENGANSSFVNQIVDEAVPPETVAADPFDAVEAAKVRVRRPTEIFRPERENSRGWDLAHRPELDALETARDGYRDTVFTAAPLIAGDTPPGPEVQTTNPALPSDTVGRVRNASADDVQTALAAATPWTASPSERAAVLKRAAALYEDHHARLFAILAREAGKSLPDAVGELREAADFLLYYAEQAEGLTRPPRGIFTCISPWNFPLAIFTGQIAGALAAGNGVLAKPAEQTPLIGHAAIELLHEAGVPREVLQFLPGDGPTVGAALTSDPRVDGVAFTGSTETAQAIRRAMADHLSPDAPLIAETGGINAMIVDSTALPEQAVRDIVASAFQSAGQRCSALRCLYVQEDIAPAFRKMLFGAMDELRMGDPWHLSTDVGPVIDAEARDGIADYLAAAGGRVLHGLTAPQDGLFIAPSVVEVGGIRDIEREVFGPVLHLATFRPNQLDQVLADIRETGFGLTFGLHTRIDDRVQYVTERLAVGNAYVNRNQIGAIVASQPFGGEGLSGTGPKAGGPEYVARFTQPEPVATASGPAGKVQLKDLQARIDAVKVSDTPLAVRDMPGPTGESNRLAQVARPPLLCLGPGPEAAAAQAEAVRALGGVAVELPEGATSAALTGATGFGGVLFWGDTDAARRLARALAARDGAILPLVTARPTAPDVLLERHLCIDTTASGGNAELLAEVSDA